VPPPVSNKKVAEDASDFQSTSESTDFSDDNDENAMMKEGDSVRMDGKYTSDNESDTNPSKIGEATNRDGEEGAQEIYTHDDGRGEVQHASEDNFLQMILNSTGDGTSLFTSW